MEKLKKSTLFVIKSALVFLLLFSNLLSQNYSWQLTGPPAGYPYNIYVLSDSAKTMLSTGTQTSNHIYKSSNNGDQWEILNNGILTATPLDITGIIDFTVDECFQDTLFASVMENQSNFHLYRSTDGGNNWINIYNNIRFDYIFARRGIVYAVQESGDFFISYDAGDNWQVLAPSPPETRNFVVGKYSGDIFVGTDLHGLYYKTQTDSVFTQIAFIDSITERLDFYETDSTHLLIVGATDWLYDGGVYLSTDKGQNWIRRDNGLPFNQQMSFVWDLEIAPSNPNVIYAGTWDAVYKTIDEGFNWFPVKNGLEIPSIVISESLAVTELFVHPHNEDFVYAGTENKGLFMTNDGGQNWSLVGFPATQVSGISVSAQNPKLVYTGAGLGFYKKQKIWQPTTIIGGLTGGIKAVTINPADSNLVLAHFGGGLGNSVIYKTINGGENWNIVYNSLLNSDIKKFLFDPSDFQRVYAIWYNGLLISDDSGSSWIENPIDFAADLAISIVNNNELYFLERSGEVQKSTNRGLSWTSIRAETDSEYTAIEIDPNNPSDIYISSYGIWKSTDYGSNWTRLNLNTWVIDLEYDYNSGHLYAATYGNGILYTTDGGITWDTLDVTPDPYFSCIDIGEGNSYSYIYAGSYGSGVFEWKLPLTPIPPHTKDSITIQKYHLFQNFPNPFNNKTQISFYLPEASNIRIEIFNILGQSIKTLISNHKMQSGYHKVHWDSRDQSNNEVCSGIYIYKIITPKFSKAKKLLLLQ